MLHPIDSSRPETTETLAEQPSRAVARELSSVLHVFEALPDQARLWAFGVSRSLDEQERAHLLATVDGFLDQWKAHGKPLSAARGWVLDRFLFVAVDPEVTPPSGCSIDALIRSLRDLELELGIEIVGSAPVWFKDESGTIQRVSRTRFKELATLGVISKTTIVFDLSLTSLEELRSGRFEGPAVDHWHRRLLP